MNIIKKITIILYLIGNIENHPLSMDDTQTPYSVNRNDIDDINLEMDNIFIKYKNQIDNDDDNNNNDDTDDRTEFYYDLEYDLPFKLNRTTEEIIQEQSLFMKNNMDLSADPCDDFYQYACGNWEKRPIPADTSEYNVFSLLNSNLVKAVKKLLSETSKQKAKNNDQIRLYTDDNSSNNHNDKPLIITAINNTINPDSIIVSATLNTDNNSNNNNNNNKDEIDAEDKAKIFYRSCINKKLLNQRGIEPLKNFIHNYGGWPVIDKKNWNVDNFDWVNLTAYSSLLGHSIILEAIIETDLKNSNSHTIYITEPDLGLSNRDDFLSDANIKHLLAYKNLIKNTIKLLGVNDDNEAELAANDIVNFEKKLANITYDFRERPDLPDLYRHLTLFELNEMNPNINWIYFLETMLDIKLNSTQSIVIFSSDYYINIENLINETDPRTLANYIQWRNVENFIENLNNDFDKIIQNFNDALTGQKNLRPRWIECIRETNHNLGMAVGAMFVRTYFDEASKNDVFSITKEMQDVFKKLLTDIDWLDESTKRLAEEKVNRTKLAVGYPNFILSKDQLNEYYKDLNIEEGKYFENSVLLRIYKAKKSRSRLFKTVDKNEWPMHPAVVNAFFEQTKNRIVIPAGILHPPIYHKKFPRFLNYGAIGAVVGHELTHGFDDIGRNFDLNGNMKEWWSNNSIEAFYERTRCFIHQYNNFSMHGKAIHGTASKGENIADNGGIRQSYFAYKKWLDDNKDNRNLMENEILPGIEMTGPQLFFLAFAQAWCGAIRPEAIENRLETDNHCPGRFRVLGTLTNFEEFAKEYQCPSGSRMNPIYRCKMW